MWVCGRGCVVCEYLYYKSVWVCSVWVCRNIVERVCGYLYYKYLLGQMNDAQECVGVNVCVNPFAHSRIIRGVDVPF